MSRWIIAAMLLLSGCGPRWPGEQFPMGTDVKRVLFAQNTTGLRETCEAMVVELTERSATRLMGNLERRNGKLVIVPPRGWSSSPVPDAGQHSFFEAAFGGCNNEGQRPLGNLEGALRRPGAFYKTINQGEGIGILVPPHPPRRLDKRQACHLLCHLGTIRQCHLRGRIRRAEPQVRLRAAAARSGLRIPLGAGAFNGRKIATHRPPQMRQR